MKHLATWMFVAGALAACGKKSDKSGAGSGSATVGGLTVSVKNLKEPDQALIKLAKDAVAGCKYDDEGYYQYDCPAMKPWNDHRWEENDALTLVTILEDPSPGMKYLASNMYEHAEWFSEKKELQERILAVAAALPKDMKGGTANKLGRTIGFFKVAKTGEFDKIKAIVDKPETNEALRVGIVNWLLAGNPDSAPAYDLTYAAATKGATPELKRAALIGLSGAYNGHASADDMCKVWLDALGTMDDADAQAMLGAHLTKGDLQVNNQNKAFPYNWAMISSDTNKCPAATVDEALKQIAALVKDGKAKSSWWTSALRGPSKAKNSTPEQKAQAIEITKAYADNTTYGGYERGGAIELLAEIDPPSGKTYADKYADDKDASIKSAVERARKTLDKK